MKLGGICMVPAAFGFVHGPFSSVNNFLGKERLTSPERRSQNTEWKYCGGSARYWRSAKGAVWFWAWFEVRNFRVLVILWGKQNGCWYAASVLLNEIRWLETWICPPLPLSCATGASVSLRAVSLHNQWYVSSLSPRLLAILWWAADSFVISIPGIWELRLQSSCWHLL